MLEIIFKTSCNHDKISPYSQSGYCPDCGEYVENHWYIARCKCCGNKYKALYKRGRVVTDAKFCTNCGCSEFVTEELEMIDVVNINYAALRKQTRRIEAQNILQTWVDKNVYIKMKLLPVY